MYIREGVHVLLKTDHPDATAEAAWTTRYGKGTILAVALGHDKKPYENPSLRQILQKGIQWCVDEARKNGAAYDEYVYESVSVSALNRNREDSQPSGLHPGL